MVTVLETVGICVGTAFVVFCLTYLWMKLRVKGEIRAARKDAVKRSRSVIGGQVAEQLAPYLPGFEHKVSEAKFLGSPVDFVVFKGMDEKDIEEVVFVEVKTGSASLSGQERRLRDAVKEGRVSWEMYRAELDE